MDMAKDYQTYQLIDFITDESFKSWVLEPTAEQNYFWQSWITNHPEKADEVAKAREFILSVKFQKLEDLPDIKASVYTQVIDQSKQIAKKSLSKRPIFFPVSTTFLKVAASVVLLLSLSLILYQLNRQKSQPPETSKVTYETKTTQRGEKLTLALPDGSIVKLNAESSLRYPISFETLREVYLRGEAYFEVARDTLKPFKVRTEAVTTEVLGTSFNVNFSSQDSTVQVAVTSGKVAVYSQHVPEKYYLLPAEVLTYDQEKFTKSHFDEELFLGWKDGILAFENADMAEITQRIGTWYDVDFEIKGKAGVTRKFSGKFKNKSLRYVLEGISFSSNFKYSIQDDQVIINLK